MNGLRLADAVTPEHFTDMSLLHALGWHSAYPDAVPADYLAEVITDDHWVPYFSENCQAGKCYGLLLYRDDVPVACACYGPARIGNAETGQPSSVSVQKDWGEVISFYTHPDETGRGYGGIIMREILKRLSAYGFSRCYVLVLRENAGARRFYEHHGFAWDGTHVDIPFPHDTICVDLRYVRRLDILGSV